MSKSSARVYMGHLPPKTTEKDIEKFFQGHGKISKINLKRGYCFVEFTDARDAESAVCALENSTILSEKVVLEIAKGTPRGRDKEIWESTGTSKCSSAEKCFGGLDSREGSRSHSPIKRKAFNGDSARSRSKCFRLVVKNLPGNASLQDLRQMFRQAGEVTNVEIYQRQINEGLIQFSSPTDMKEAARKFDGYVLNGKRIRVFEDAFSTEARKRFRRESPSHNQSSRSMSQSPVRMHKGENGHVESTSDKPKLESAVIRAKARRRLSPRSDCSDKGSRRDGGRDSASSSRNGPSPYRHAYNNTNGDTRRKSRSLSSADNDEKGDSN